MKSFSHTIVLVRRRLLWGLVILGWVLTGIFVVFWNLGVEIGGGYDAGAGGSAAEWVTGILTVAALGFAGWELRESQQIRSDQLKANQGQLTHNQSDLAQRKLEYELRTDELAWSRLVYAREREQVRKASAELVRIGYSWDPSTQQLAFGQLNNELGTRPLYRPSLRLLFDEEVLRRKGPEEQVGPSREHVIEWGAKYYAPGEHSSGKQVSYSFLGEEGEHERPSDVVAEWGDGEGDGTKIWVRQSEGVPNVDIVQKEVTLGRFHEDRL